jgi:hypothetical protein
MGTRNGRSNTYLNGRIDEASYFTRAISATEISAINSPNTGESTAATIITSTGKFVDNSSNVLMRQTIVATFDVSGSSMNITNYDETTGHITP